MRDYRKINNKKHHYIIGLFLILSAMPVLGAETGLPWEAPLQKILDSLTGPVARIIGVIAITLAGFAIAFGEGGSGVRRILQIVFGLSIAFMASSILLSLFGFSGGLVF